MDYTEYFRRFPDAYAKIIAGLDRATTLYDFLVDGGLLEGSRTILSIGSGTGEVEIRIARNTGRQIAVVEPSKMFCEKFHQNVASYLRSDTSTATNSPRQDRTWYRS